MKPRKLSSIIATFVPCYAFWLLLTMSLKPSELLGGLIVCGITAWFSSGFLIQQDVQFLHYYNPMRVVKFILFIFVVLIPEILKANVAMAKVVLTGKPLKQAIIKIPVHGVTNYYGLAVLADCITLTPGTITTDVAIVDGRIVLYVQWLIMESEDPEEAGEIIKGKFERWIGEIWG